MNYLTKFPPFLLKCIGLSLVIGVSGLSIKGLFVDKMSVSLANAKFEVQNHKLETVSKFNEVDGIINDLNTVTKNIKENQETNKLVRDDIQQFASSYRQVLNNCPNNYPDAAILIDDNALVNPDIDVKIEEIEETLTKVKEEVNQTIEEVSNTDTGIKQHQNFPINTRE